MAVAEIRSVIAGAVWKIDTKVGDRVGEDAVIMVLESMKMEIPIVAPEDGVILALHVAEGQAISEGQLVATLELA